MWRENYETHWLLFADENMILWNFKTGEKRKEVRCMPDDVKLWIEIQEKII